MYRILLVIFLLSSSFLVTANEVTAPVMVGSNDDLDACSSLGMVFGLNPKGDGFLAVRSGKNATAPLVDKLLENQKVFICNASKDGKWLGVVYTHDDVNECGVSTPINPAQPYKGNCKSGWVNARWIKLLAE